MITYILWTFSGIQGPMGAETLRFSNYAYVIDSGPDAGESFQDSWTETSYSSFGVTRTGFTITPDGLLRVGGLVPPEAGSIEVANNYPSAVSTVRQLDYLFGSDYDLSNVTVTGELKTSLDGTPPAYSSFIPFFTGTLSLRPTRTSDTVTFHVAPTASLLNGPMLTARQTGMGSFYIFQFVSEAIENNPPAIINTDFTLQFFGSFVLGAGASGKQTLYKIEDGLSIPLIDLYIDTSENLKLGVNHSTGTDVYALWSRPVDERQSEDFFWATVSWNNTGGTMSAWVNGVKVVDATPILNTPTGVPADNIFADISNNSAANISSVRVFDTAYDESGVLEREGPIDHAEDTTLLNAWEFDDAVGDVCTDYGPSSRHVPLPSSNKWQFRQTDGDRWQEGKIVPLVLGSVFGAPVILTNPKQPGGIVSVAGGGLKPLRAYSKGVPLSTFESVTAPFRFDRITPAIGSITAATTTVFGRFHVPGEAIEVSGAFDPQYDGTYIIKEIVPRVSGSLFPSFSGPFDDRFSVVVESHSWGSSGTGNATVKTATSAATDWTVTSGAGLEGDFYASGVPIQGIIYSWAHPHPLAADVVGDPTIYLSSPPATYANPDRLLNVLLQAMKTYGPEFNDTILPPSYSFSTIPYRVGYYVNDETPTRDVVDNLSRSCLTWIEEDGAGVISFSEFTFPEDVGSSEEIFADDIDPSSVVTDRFSSTARRNVSSPFVTSVITRYLKNWTPLEENDVPQVVDPEVRSFVTREWRQIIAGDAGLVTTDTPIFETYENRRGRAKTIGDKVLRLARGEVAEFDMRLDPEDQLTSFLIGSKAVGDLTRLGLGDVDRIVIGREALPGAGLLHLVVWFEN